MGRRSPPPVVALRPFVEALEARVAAMSLDELRAAVVSMARDLDPGARSAFLERVGASLPVARDDLEVLLADLEALEEVAAATGEPGWPDDDEWDDRRGWEDLHPEVWTVGWAPRFVDLVRRAGAVFVHQEPSVAAGVYERLFDVAASAAAKGWAVVGEVADELLVDAAAVGYLRSAGEAPAGPERSRRLRDAVHLITPVTRSSGLSADAITAARAAAPLDLDGLVDDWVEAIRPLADTGNATGDRAFELLVDIVASWRGPEALGPLARAGGPRAGQLFVAWAERAHEEGDVDGFVEAAGEGVRVLPAGAERAVLADALAARATRSGDGVAAAEAAVAAWAAEPSLDRLLAAVDAGRQAGSEAATITALRTQPKNLPAVVEAVLAVLAGDLRRLARRAPTPPPKVGRESRRAVIRVEAAVLLAAGADATRQPAWSRTVLRRVVGELDSAVGLSMHADWRSVSFAEGCTLPAPTTDLTLSDLVVEALEGAPLGPADRARLLSAGAVTAAGLVADIVETKHRQAYGQAAAFAMAHAEAVAILDGPAAGDRVGVAAELHYPRHTAYRGELATARRSSPLLSPPVPRGRLR